MSNYTCLFFVQYTGKVVSSVVTRSSARAARAAKVTDVSLGNITILYIELHTLAV